MRLGTLPIVAPTGGLKDTVEAVFLLDEKDWGVGGETTLTQPWKIRCLMAFMPGTIGTFHGYCRGVLGFVQAGF